jgi:hypothetical protein
MDPEDGIITDPATLHKYDYAGGDPVNAMDPTGRDAILGYGLITSIMLGPPTTIKEYDIYTGKTKELSGAATIVALEQLACSVNTVFSGASVALSREVPQMDFVECTAWRKKTDDCLSAPPEPSNSPKCNAYGGETYLGDSLSCFCKCAGDSAWSEQVRGCLACEHQKGTEITVAHEECYRAAGVTKTPWGVIGKCWKQCLKGGIKVPIPPVLPPFPLPPVPIHMPL